MNGKRTIGIIIQGKRNLTLPWTVPSPAEKRGGLGKGLTTLSRKKQIVTKTSTKGTLLNLGEGGPPGESMTSCSESRKEATSPIPFLSSKKISKIGTLNLRTMFEANKAAPIARERRAYNITVLWLCETRWTQSGQVRLNTGEMILYSGHEEEDAHHTEWKIKSSSATHPQTTRMRKQRRTFTTNCKHCVTN